MLPGLTALHAEVIEAVCRGARTAGEITKVLEEDSQRVALALAYLCLRQYITRHSDRHGNFKFFPADETEKGT